MESELQGSNVYLVRSVAQMVRAFHRQSEGYGFDSRQE